MIDDPLVAALKADLEPMRPDPMLRIRVIARLEAKRAQRVQALTALKVGGLALAGCMAAVWVGDVGVDPILAMAGLLCLSGFMLGGRLRFGR